MNIERLGRAALVALALGLAGCDRDELPGMSRRTTKLEEIPAPVVDAAKKALPDTTLQDAWRNVDREGKLHSYEIRARAKNGKIREVRVSQSGEILEME